VSDHQPLPAFSNDRFVDFATTELTIGQALDNLQDAQAGVQELTGGVTTQREKLDTTGADLATTTADLATCQTALQIQGVALALQTHADHASLSANAGPPCDDTADGLVHVDINRDGTVDLLDATSLFVAQTMKGFGASAVLTRLYAAQHKSDVDVDRIMEEMSSAMAQVRGHTGSTTQAPNTTASANAHGGNGNAQR
jgi:hypothetical protein